MIDWLQAAGIHDCRGAGDRRSVPDDRTERRTLRRRDNERRQPGGARGAGRRTVGDAPTGSTIPRRGRSKGALSPPRLAKRPISALFGPASRTPARLALARCAQEQADRTCVTFNRDCLTDGLAEWPWIGYDKCRSLLPRSAAAGASFDEAGALNSDWDRSQAVGPQSDRSCGAEALFERPGGKRRLSGSSPQPSTEARSMLPHSFDHSAPHGCFAAE